MDLTTDDLIDQSRYRVANPLLDTSFSSAVRQSIPVTIDDDYSISQFLNEGKLRERNDALDKLVNEQFLPLDVQNDFNKKYYSLGQINSYYDAIAKYLMTIPERDRPAMPDGSKEWKTRFEIMSPIWDDMEKRRAALGQTVEHGDWLTVAGMYVGGAFASAGDPLNIFITAGTVGVGVGRSVVKAGSTIKNIEQAVEATRRLQNLSKLREAAKFGGYEAMVNVAAESTIMMQNAAWRDASGNPYTAQDVLLSLTGAAVIGGAIGGVAGGLTARSTIKKADAAMGRYEENLRIFQEQLSGIRDSRGRVTTQPAPAYDQTVVGDPTWSQDQTNVNVYDEYKNVDTTVNIEGRQVFDQPGTLRLDQPPPIKKGQRQVPLDAYATDLYMAFDTNAFSRLANQQLVYSTDADTRSRFDLFSTPQQAAEAVPQSAVQIRLEPSQVVGFIRYAPKGFRVKTSQAWERGEAHFLVNKESRFEPEGRTDNFLFDAATNVQFEIPSLANRYAKALLRLGFIRDPLNPGTGFVRPSRAPLGAADLTTLVNDMTTAMQAYDLGVDVLRGLPEDVQALPADMVIDGIRTAADNFMSPSLLPKGQGVSNFRAHTGVDITAMPETRAGVTPARSQDVVLPDNYTEIEQRIRQLVATDEGKTMLQFDESTPDNQRMVPMKETFEVMDADIAATQQALQCILGVAASGE